MRQIRGCEDPWPRGADMVLTIELSEAKQAHARAQLQKAKLADHVEWLQGDALEILDRIEGPIDFVLLDLWKELYVPCFERFLPKLAENGIIAADNMLEPKVVRPQAEIYRAAVRAVPSLQSVLLSIGQGIELSCVWRARVGIGIPGCDEIGTDVGHGILHQLFFRPRKKAHA